MVHSKIIKCTILAWLLCTGFLVICTALLGGYTRLTGSGLSITEWKPIVGIFPPITALDWNIEFQKYQKSLEYIQINFDMSLNEFKVIFFIEYVHRMIGRITFIAYIIPWIYLLSSKKIKNDIYLTLVFLGIILQGVAGWYMVKSGLVNNPQVSHFRLLLHFLLALFIYKIIFFRFLHYKYSILVDHKIFKKKNSKKFRILFFTFYLLFLFQVIWGCFVAALKAGLIYNSYPLMGNNFVPSEMDNEFNFWYLFSDVVYVQFIHRIFAILVFMFSLMIFLYSHFVLHCKKLIIASSLLFCCTTMQFCSGVFTLLFHLPIFLALFHQLGVFIIASFVVYMFFLITISE